MNGMFKAKIIWIPIEKGGRRTIPVGNKYAPIIIERNRKMNSQEPVWSLFVENKNTLEDHITLAEVHYLSEKAPNNLTKGYKFDLYEGSKKVAEGEIL